MTTLPRTATAQDDPVDLTRTLPPQPGEVASSLTDALRSLIDDGDAPRLLRAAAPGGSATDREAGAAWLGRRIGHAVDPSRVILTNGTQMAFRLLARHRVDGDGVVLTEALTWGVLVPLAAHLGVRLVPVDIDEEGMVPEALAEACRREPAALIYCNPTHHNPTTATMSTGRRSALADVARAHGVPIFEDDAVGALHPDGPPAIASIAPDITWYAMGLTKCLAQGLRAGYLVAPSAADGASLRSTVDRLSHWVTHPIAAAILRHLITTGRADTITAAIRAEGIARQHLAARLLTGFTFRAADDALHLWLQVPGGATSTEFSRAAAAGGVLVRPAEQFAVDPSTAPAYVRVSLGSPVERADVELGLERLAGVGRRLSHGETA